MCAPSQLSETFSDKIHVNILSSRVGEKFGTQVADLTSCDAQQHTKVGRASSGLWARVKVCCSDLLVT